MRRHNNDRFIVDTGSGQILRNGYFTFFNFGTYCFIGIVLVPYLVGKFGSTGYGLLTIAGVFTQYVGLISNSIANSVNRYMIVELNRQNWWEANEIFNSAIVIFIIILVLKIPIFALGILNLDVFFSFPSSLSNAFCYLVLANIISFSINLFSGVFSSIFAARNRLDILSKLDTIFLVLRTVLLVLLLEVYSIDIKLVGHLEILLSSARFVIIFILFSRYAGQLRYNPKNISVKWFRPILTMSSWMLISSLGFTLFLKTDVWILNKLISPAVAGVYAALLVWPNFLKQIANQISNLLLPVITIEVARNNMQRVEGICLASSRLLVLVSLSLTFPVIAFPEEILKYWAPALGQYFYLLPWMVFYLAFTMPECVLWGVFQAENRMDIKGKNDIICGILNVIISIILVIAGLNEMGVALGTSIALILRNAILTPFYATRLINASFRPYIHIQIVSLVMILLAFTTGEVFRLYSLRLSEWSTGIILLSSIVLGGILSCFLLFGNKDTKNLLRMLINTVLTRQPIEKYFNIFSKQ